MNARDHTTQKNPPAGRIDPNTLVDFTVDGQPLTLVLLDRAHVQQAAALCDECVGANLYREEALKEVLEKPESYFFMLTDQTGRIVGYISFHRSDINEAAEFLRSTPEQVARYLDPSRYLVQLQSIGVLPAMRHKGLAVRLLEFALAFSREVLHADLAFVACWRQGDFVPMYDNIRKFGFTHLYTVPKMWYNVPDLYCPYCKGRCTCSAEIYAIDLKKGG